MQLYQQQRRTHIAFAQFSNLIGDMISLYLIVRQQFLVSIIKTVQHAAPALYDYETLCVWRM